MNGSSNGSLKLDCRRHSAGGGSLVWMVSVVCLALAMFGTPATGQAAEPMSISDFVQLKDKWPEFARAAVRFELEGRVSTVALQLMRFRNCPLDFVAGGGVEFPRRSQRPEVSLVEGNLVEQAGEIVFRVTSYRELGDDAVLFRRRWLKLDDRRVDDYYELARAMQKRSVFYDDPQLAGLAQEVHEDALRIELSSLERDDAVGVRRLAAKASSLGMGDRPVRELLHRALWMERQSGDGTAGLLSRVRRDLPGTKSPIDPPQPKLRERYLHDPFTVFRDAPDDERQKLARILWTDVLLKDISRAAAADGSNGHEIADRIDAELPEYHDLAEKHRSDWLTYRSRDIDSAPREDMLALARIYRQRDEDEKSRDVLRAWLKAREQDWRKEGPIGTVRLAEEYLELLEDRATAILLLRQAYIRSGQDAEIAERLRGLGVSVDGRPVERPPAGPVAVEGAAQESPIRVGMTGEQVRRVLGAPDEILRVASASEVTEIWSFRTGGASQLAVQFSRRLSQARPVSRVVTVSRLGERR